MGWSAIVVEKSEHLSARLTFWDLWEALSTIYIETDARADFEVWYRETSPRSRVYYLSPTATELSKKSLHQDFRKLLTPVQEPDDLRQLTRVTL